MIYIYIEREEREKRERYREDKGIKKGKKFVLIVSSEMINKIIWPPGIKKDQIVSICKRAKKYRPGRFNHIAP